MQNNSLFIAIQSHIETPWKTPDNWNGHCIVIQQCRPIYDILAGPLTTEERNFLRKSQCGHDGTNPLVCCPNTFTVNDLPAGQQCGSSVGDKIVGGEIASIDEFPWYELNVSTPIETAIFVIC